MSLRDRIRVLLRLFFLFTVLVVVAVLSAITTIRVTVHRGVETLPNLVGKTFDQARSMAAPLGLEVVADDRLFSRSVPEGKIISQLPVAGVHIKPGQHVHVLVSLGPPSITVPNVVGSSLRAARIMAIQSGLTMGDMAVVHWPGGESDEVVGQDPPPSSSDLHSPAINFLVSEGDAPDADVCPNFVGQPFQAAKAALLRAGFQLIQETPVASTGSVQGTIVGQTPPPGSRITSDSEFNFQVAE